MAAPAPLFAPPGMSKFWSLAGISRFGVLIERLNENAEQCGITTNSLTTSLRFVLGQSRMIVLDQVLPTDGIIYLNVNVLPNCAASIELDVEAPTTILTTNHFVLAVIWDTEYLRTGGDAGKNTLDHVEELAKELVNDWNSANPP